MEEVPKFLLEWNDEFTSASYRPSCLIFCCWISLLHFALEGVKGVTGVLDEAGGDFQWRLWTWASYFGIAAISVAVILAHRSTSRKICRICERNYEKTCIFCLFLWNLAVIYPQVLTEYRRSRFQYQELKHITWGIDYFGLLPVRTCTDSDPVRTWTHGPLRVHSVGCNSMLLGAGNSLSYFLLSLLPPVVNMRRNAALVASFANLLLLVVALAITGAWCSAPAAAAVTIHICSGLAAAYLCMNNEASAQQHFAVSKRVRFLAARSRALLHTFIPQDVADRLPLHATAEMLGAAVDGAVVMFCALEPQASISRLCGRAVMGWGAGGRHRIQTARRKGAEKAQEQTRRHHSPRLEAQDTCICIRRRRRRVCQMASGLAPVEGPAAESALRGRSLRPRHAAESAVRAGMSPEPADAFL